MLRRRPLLPGSHTLCIFAPLLAILVASSSANAQAPEPDLPRLVLAPQASMSFGQLGMVAAELGGTLAYRFPDVLDVGLHAAAMNGYGRSVEGCMDLRYCIQSWWRAGGTVERHFNSRGRSDPWIGLELEALRVTAVSLSYYPPLRESHVGLHVAPKVGIDWARHWQHGLMGFGMFAALPVDVGLHLGGVGFMLGMRMPFGFF
jgi:hypothetical protein